MKQFWEWVVRNLSNIFSGIGILLTLYMGVFYVPTWLDEAQYEKNINAQKELVQSIKELAYSDSICYPNEISILVKAKEIELNKQYPMSTQNLLTKVQESFMQDKFLPLEKRKLLISKIETIKDYFKDDNVIEENRYEKSHNALSTLSIIVSLLTVFVGIVSFYLKFKTEKEKDEEIESQIIGTENYSSNIEFAFEYEKKLLRIVRNYPNIEVVKTSNFSDFSFDILFEYKHVNHYLEARYLSKSKVGLSSIQKFINSIQGLEGVFWFVHNTELTNMTKRKINEAINMLANERRSIYVIKAESEYDFQIQFNKIMDEL